MVYRRINKGRNFETLIAWIQKSVHNKAEIETNKRIKDIDTGKFRQVDITIKLSDGPTEFFGIVEVRDRKSKVGVCYVEELSSKQRSVRADAVFLVSKSGFTKPASVKAEKLGIRLLTYEEAKDGDWSAWLKCRSFSVVHRKYDKPVLHFFDAKTGKPIKPSEKFIKEFNKNKDSKLILNKAGEPLISIPDLIKNIINIYGEKTFEGVDLDGSRVRQRLLFDGKFSDPIFIEDAERLLTQIGKVGIEADFYFETVEYPMKLMKYKNYSAKESIAELATSEVEILGKKYKFEILAPGAGEYIPAGATVSFRSIPINKEEKSE
jgi:hypothetical protein